jgi:hypothetical protein
VSAKASPAEGVNHAVNNDPGMADTRLAQELFGFLNRVFKRR